MKHKRNLADLAMLLVNVLIGNKAYKLSCEICELFSFSHIFNLCICINTSHIYLNEYLEIQKLNENKVANKQRVKPVQTRAMDFWM